MITTDDCSTYPEVLLKQYGETVLPARTGKAGRPRLPHKRWPAGSAYATVNKTYAKGTVTAVSRKLVHGTPEDLAVALDNSRSSKKINTSFVERQNGTDRCHNARKARKTYEFSKDLLVHVAVTWWVFVCYNFHHAHSSLRIKNVDGTFTHRTPAMAIGIERTALSVREILMAQVAGGAFAASTATLADFGRRRVPGGSP